MLFVDGVQMSVDKQYVRAPEDLLALLTRHVTIRRMAQRLLGHP